MRRRTAAHVVSLLGMLASAFGGAAWAAETAQRAAAHGKYIRVDRDLDGEPLALQTAIVRFASDDSSPVTVDLIGAVHVGDQAYYESLNKQFEGYDTVLYELVAPEGTRVPKGGKPSAHPVAMLQNGLKDLLQLEHQLQYIDYSKANLIHADMSPEDFAKSMSDRKESFATMFFRMMGQAMAQQALDKPKPKGKSADFDLFAAFFDKDRAGSLKRVMAEQFENMDGMMDVLGGTQGSTIITERNKVALKKLTEQIAGGKKKIAIFYGAGHMGDMEKHLADDFHLRQTGEQWLTAWQLKRPAPAAKPAKKPAAESPAEPALAPG